MIFLGRQILSILILLSQSSVFVRDWALERWEEGQQVSLRDELPKLKTIIRLAHERGDHVVAASEDYPRYA